MSDQDADTPDTNVCEDLCKQFVDVTKSNSMLAHWFLQEAKWNLEAALNQYFASNATKDDDHGEPKEPEHAADQEYADAFTTPPEFADSKGLRLLSWNIDGLDQNGISIRTKAVCTIVMRDKPTVVFLQEVVNDSVSILADYLSDQYWVLKGKNPKVLPAPAYFTAMLLNKAAVGLDREPEVISFSGSMMDRTLLKIEVDIYGVPCVLMTSHLESMKDHAQERMRQLRTCFEILEKNVPDNVTAFFGGDLNLREAELKQIGGPPPGVEDLWITCGSPHECRFTWDAAKNDNSQFDQIPAASKPRSRYDRIYIKHATAEPGPVWKPNKFNLVGTQRIKKYDRFPSDHFGIMCDMEKISYDKGD